MHFFWDKQKADLQPAEQSKERYCTETVLFPHYYSLPPYITFTNVKCELQMSKKQNNWTKYLLLFSP